MSNIFFQTENLTLGYGNEIVIKDLDLSLQKIRNYEVIGKNGSGKTTLLNLLSNNFEGNTFDSDISREATNILEISHIPTLLENLTLIENVIYFTSSMNIDEEKVNSTIKKYDMLSFKNDTIKNFSSGMIKRTELAIADIKEPDVLCIDEPLNYLDKQGIDRLQNLINERTDKNKSNILSSQETSGLLKNKETVNLNET